MSSPHMMTFHRFAYKVCWKNRVLVPLAFILASVVLICVLLHDASFELRPGGKIRVKYYYPATLNPLDLAPVTEDGKSDDVQVLHRKITYQHPISSRWGVEEGEVILRWEDNRPQIQDDILTTPRFSIDRQDDSLKDNVLFVQPKMQGVPNKNEHQLQESKDEHRTLMRKKKHKSRLKFKPVWKNSLYYNRSEPPELFKTWRLYEDNFCDGNFKAYFNEFAMLSNVKVDKDHCRSSRKGGEKIDDVLNQAEEAEYFTYETGSFQQNCKERPSYYFNNNNHMNDWLYSLKTLKLPSKGDYLQKQFVIAVVRHEYVNLYHTMSDWYNAFLMMQFFNKTQAETNIVLFDAHPQGSLDSPWLVLFNTTRRLSALPKRTLFNTMVWNIIGYNSPLLDHYGPTLPLVEEFRDFFLTSFAVPGNLHQLNCSSLGIMFIWRRDYVAHPRNPQGSISRKVQNERELMTYVQKEYPMFHVRGVQIDLFDMQKQLSLVASTDIMIGMHGAGLTHALFLPKHAGLIELLPNYWSAANDHFYAIAQWRKLVYERWINEDPQNEGEDFYTHVPSDVVHGLLKSVIQGMCMQPKYR